MAKDSTTKISLPTLLTIEQVDAYAQVSTRQVHRWIKSGALPVVRLGRSVRVSENDLALFIATQKSQ